MPLKPKIKIRLLQLDIKEQQEFAKKFGINPQTLSGWVTGRNNPTLETAFKLAKRLDCKVDDLWELKEE